MKMYDVIIIGAGNGGLTAAATCAKAGLSTLLLERHNLPGGAATSFVRGRFEFETSLHELAGVGAPDRSAAVEALFDRLGADVEFLIHDYAFRLIVPAKEGDSDAFINENGVSVTIDARMPIGFEAFSRKLDELVPGSYDSCMEAFKLSTNMYKIFNNMDDPKKLVGYAKYLPDVMRMTSYTMKECLDALGMPKKAQDIFCTYWSYAGLPSSQLDFLFYIAMTHIYLEYGAGLPRMRSHELSLALDKVIRDNGGDIFYNSEVTKVIMKNGKPAGVVVNGEKEIYGKYFICNSHPNTVFRDLFDEKEVPEKQYKMINSRKPAVTLTTVYLGMNKTKEELGIKDYSVFIAPDADSDKQYELLQDGFGGYCVINCLNEVIPDCTPEGTCQLFLTTLTYDDVMANVKPQDYKKYKTEIARKMIEICEKALNISITPYIEEIEIALPPTFSRYLNTPFGTPYGYRLEKWDGMIPRTVQYNNDMPFDNFLFCGATQDRGDGYSCAYSTGENTAKMIIKKMKEDEKNGKKN